MQKNTTLHDFTPYYTILNSAQRLCYTTPLKPMNAIAKRPAVKRAIGVPCIAFGTLANANCSRIPANNTNANAKPKAVAIAKNIPVNNPGSAPIGNLYVPLATMIATPNKQQFVVIYGKNTPNAWYKDGEIFLRIISIICTSAAITKINRMVCKKPKPHAFKSCCKR